MLVLTRKLNESIWIGDKIEIKVSYLDSTRVRLAIQAPKDIKILRGELREKING